MIIKTVDRQQPVDNFTADVYSKPVADYKDTKLKAGQSITFSYQDQQFTQVIGGFSIRSGVEVMWTKSIGDVCESRFIEYVSDIKVNKPKKRAKKTTKKKKK